MLRQFRYFVCAMLVGLVSQGGRASLAPACEPCSASYDRPANVKAAPQRRVRVRWVAVYEGGRVRFVLRAYRTPVSAPTPPPAPELSPAGTEETVPTISAREVPDVQKRSGAGPRASGCSPVRSRTGGPGGFGSGVSRSPGSCDSRTVPAQGTVRSVPRGNEAGSRTRSSFGGDNPQGRRVGAGRGSRAAR